MKQHKNLPKFDDNSYVHFTTTGTCENRPYFRDEELCQILLEELRFYRDKYGFTLLGYVIMPDHVHLLLWWDKTKKPDLNVSKVIQGIKGATARRIIGLMTSGRLKHPLQPCSITALKNSKSHKQNLRYRLWQHGFYDFNIYTEEKLLEKLNYIHHNPVKAGLVGSPADYKWSSYMLYFGTTGVEESISSPDMALGADAPRYPRVRGSIGSPDTTPGADAPEYPETKRVRGSISSPDTTPGADAPGYPKRYPKYPKSVRENG